MERAIVIVNPSSGKEEAEACLDEVRAALKKRNCISEIRMTEKEGDATVFAKEACDEKYDVVVSMGGDGTLSEVINGLSEQSHRPTLGIIPLGTVNDFARALDIPMKTQAAIENLSSSKTRSVDIGKVNDKYFMNIVAIGDLAAATFTVTPKQKTMLGPLAYFLEGVKSLTGKSTLQAVIKHDGGVWEDECLLILAALTNSVGGFEKITPDAEVNDGLIHCMIIKNVALPKLVQLATSILKGDHLDDPSIEYIQSTQLSIRADKQLPANIDGDEGEKLPLDFQVLKGHLDAIVS